MSQEVEIKKLAKMYRKLSDTNKRAIDEVVSILIRDVNYRLQIQTRQKQQEKQINAK
jgi:ribonucleotide reductase beta subunit family protein with ferritin-like domain